MANSSAPLLELVDLEVRFQTWRGVVQAVRGVSLKINHNEIVGLIGESGAGKSVTGRSIMNLLTTRPGITGGQILVEGQDILTMAPSELDRIQGNAVTYISQDPLSSLNPVFTIGEQLIDAIIWSTQDNERSRSSWIYGPLKRLTPEERSKTKKAERRSVESLARVGLSDAERHMRDYPHQLSGGMRQRVLIAMALVKQPKLLIADEPTTALDVTVQAQILNLIKRLSESEGLAVLYISHDLSVVAQLCDRVAVMYAGHIVELADTKTLYRQPVHPYTSALLAVTSGNVRAEDLYEIPGEVVDMLDPPVGCAFHPRCPLAQESCRTENPLLKEIEEGHWVACPPGTDLYRNRNQS
jgi:peptide/nickel transport system ATP-binding protein